MGTRFPTLAPVLLLLGAAALLLVRWLDFLG